MGLSRLSFCPHNEHAIAVSSPLFWTHLPYASQLCMIQLTITVLWRLKPNIRGCEKGERGVSFKHFRCISNLPFCSSYSLDCKLQKGAQPATALPYYVRRYRVEKGSSPLAIRSNIKQQCGGDKGEERRNGMGWGWEEEGGLQKQMHLSGEKK